MTSTQPNLKPHPSFILRTLKDMDEAEAIMRRIRPDIRVEPLSLDGFHVDFAQVDFGDLLVYFAKVHRPFHYLGPKRSGFIQFATAPYATRQTGFFVHNHPLQANTLFGFDPSSDTNSIAGAATFIAEIQVRQDLFTATCQAMRRDDLDRQFLQREYMYLPTTIQIYNAFLRELFRLVATRSPLLQSDEYRYMILGDLLPLLIDAIPRQTLKALPYVAPSRRVRLVNQTRDFLLANLARPLTLKDIYTYLGVSRRTLYYSFESIFEMTPVQYLKVLRLQGARRSLKQAAPQSGAITEIAHQYGFWGIKRFARDYKRMFGELPSRTLKTSSNDD